VEEVSEVMELTEDQVRRAFRDFRAKYAATQHLRNLPPSLLAVGPAVLSRPFPIM